MTAGSAWYSSDRENFLTDAVEAVVGRLASTAAAQGLHVESEQHVEWRSSVGILKKELAHRTAAVAMLRSVLAPSDLAEYRHVILEYDLRRRGLRIDCVLLGDGIVAVLEFKRSRVTPADREQVINYCANLVEFHSETARTIRAENVIVAPILVLTSGRAHHKQAGESFLHAPWDSILAMPLVADAESLQDQLRAALRARRATTPIHVDRWLNAKFSPSSTILDAALSLYGQHNVSAISNHSAPLERIESCTAEIRRLTAETLRSRANRIIFVSGTPGTGKTLVGLKIVFDPELGRDTVFVTGNAPLVDVLNHALRNAYRQKHLKGQLSAGSLCGYAKEQAIRVMKLSTYKIVKAHHFLGDRGSDTRSEDGRIVVFDEAQRTYEQGKEVLRKRLEEDEAKLILKSLERSYERGSVVIALVGHNQAINRGELGIVAWLRAAVDCGWRYAISDETLELSEIANSGPWATSAARDKLEVGHLRSSLRFYRSGDMERWAEHLLRDDSEGALRVAETLEQSGDYIWLTRSLSRAKDWVRSRRVGQERSGIIASGQARRLEAEGLFVRLKPDIAQWMLAESSDVRSSNMLETVQNQYQIQGLELDYTIVCWDCDLRRHGSSWRSFRLSGSAWKTDREIEFAKNGYRVLLTRARKALVIFVPRGDETGDDETRRSKDYDEIADYLVACGARTLDS